MTGVIRRAALLAATSACALGAAPALAAPAEAGVQLEELIVTARKREETLQSVPVSVAAYTGEALARQGITDVVGLARAVPGTFVQDGGPGFRQVFVRGITSDRGNSATTGFYYDEAFVPPGGVGQAVIEPVYFDVRQIEVLRGPQGTVFGGSAMGGAVRILPNEPDAARFEAALGGDLSFTQDGGLNVQLDGMVNMPLVEDRAALRIAGSVRRDEGVIDLLLGDFSGPGREARGAVERRRNVNDLELGTVRAALLLRPTDWLSITPSLFYQNLKADGFSAQDRQPMRRDIRRRVATPESLKDEFVLGSLKIEADLPGDLRLLSATNYSKRDPGFSEDGSEFIAQSWLPGFGLPPVYVVNDLDSMGQTTLFSQELRLSTAGDQRLQFVAGAYYEDAASRSVLEVNAPALVTALPIVGRFFPGGLLFHQTSRFDRKQLALFGEGVFAVTEALKVTGGLRWFRYDVEAQTGTATLAGPVAKSREDGYSPRVSVSYQIDPHRLVYATAAKGFRPGGANRIAPPPYNTSCRADYAAAGRPLGPDALIPPYTSDSLWNYELGAKTRWLGGALTLNGAVYVSEWSDIQQLFFPPCGLSSTANFGSAEVKGVELEFQARLSPSLSVFGGVNHLDAKLSEDIPQLGLRAGTELQNTPRWSGSLNGLYTFDGPAGSEGGLLLSYRFVDDSYRDFDRTNPLKRQEGFGALNARLTFRRGGAALALYANNLTDENPAVSNLVSAYGPIRSHERFVGLTPRTVGVNLRVDY